MLDEANEIDMGLLLEGALCQINCFVRQQQNFQGKILCQLKEKDRGNIVHDNESKDENDFKSIAQSMKGYCQRIEKYLEKIISCSDRQQQNLKSIIEKSQQKKLKDQIRHSIEIHKENLTSYKKFTNNKSQHVNTNNLTNSLELITELKQAYSKEIEGLRNKNKSLQLELKYERIRKQKYVEKNESLLSELMMSISCNFEVNGQDNKIKERSQNDMNNPLLSLPIFSGNISPIETKISENQTSPQQKNKVHLEVETVDILEQVISRLRSKVKKLTEENEKLNLKNLQNQRKFYNISQMVNNQNECKKIYIEKQKKISFQDSSQRSETLKMAEMFKDLLNKNQRNKSEEKERRRQSISPNRVRIRIKTYSPNKVSFSYK